MINKLEVEISNDPISGLKRKMEHVKLEIDETLNMRHIRRIVFYEKLSDDSYGRPVLQMIEEDETLTREQKNLKNFPDGSVPELEFWQSLPIAFLQPAPSKCSEVIYGLMRMSMKSQDNQNRV